MEINADFDLLKKTLNEAIQKLQRTRNEDKRKSSFIVLYGAFASGLTTVLIGLSTYSILKEYAVYLTIAALIISASLTVIQAWDGLFHHKRLWIIQAQALNKFKELNDDLLHMEKSKPIDQKLVNQCYSRYKEIHRVRNSEWSTIRTKD